MSKGSKRRPTANYESNYDAIDWGKKQESEKKDEKKLDKKRK